MQIKLLLNTNRQISILIIHKEIVGKLQFYDVTKTES